MPRRATNRQAIVRVQMEWEAKRALDDLVERRRMTQTAVTSRLVTGLVGQDDVIQASVLGIMSDQRLGELARLRLGTTDAGV